MQSLNSNTVSNEYMHTSLHRNEKFRVIRLPFDCIQKHSFGDAVKDKDGDLVYPESSVNILSTTTKFTGYKEESTWLAPPPVIKAVSILQAITGVIAKLSNTASEQCPLFCSTMNIKLRTPVEVSFSIPKSGVFQDSCH